MAFNSYEAKNRPGLHELCQYVDVITLRVLDVPSMFTKAEGDIISRGAGELFITSFPIEVSCPREPERIECIWILIERAI